MAHLSKPDKQTVVALKRLRAILSSNLAFRLEFLGMVSQLLRNHNVTIPDDVLANLTLAVPGELETRGMKPPLS